MRTTRHRSWARTHQHLQTLFKDHKGKKGIKIERGSLNGKKILSTQQLFKLNSRFFEDAF